jgi:hypothetical protein
VFDVLTESGLEARRSNPIATMISEEVGEYAAAHPEICVDTAVGAFRFWQCQTRCAQ